MAGAGNEHVISRPRGDAAHHAIIEWNLADDRRPACGERQGIYLVDRAEMRVSLVIGVSGPEVPQGRDESRSPQASRSDVVVDTRSAGNNIPSRHSQPLAGGNRKVLKR